MSITLLFYLRTKIQKLLLQRHYKEITKLLHQPQYDIFFNVKNVSNHSHRKDLHLQVNPA